MRQKAVDKHNLASVDKGKKVQSASPKLAAAINTQIKNNQYISRALENRENVSFEVKGGRLIAKDSKGDIIHRGEPDEFRGHQDIKINAAPERRRLGEVLVDKDSLREKQKMEGRAAPHITTDASSDKQLKKQYENDKINDKESHVGMAPIGSVRRGFKRILSWGRTPAVEKSNKKEQGQERRRGGR